MCVFQCVRVMFESDSNPQNFAKVGLKYPARGDAQRSAGVRQPLSQGAVGWAKVFEIHRVADR